MAEAHRFDPAVPRRMYWTDELEDPSRCPSCQGELQKEDHTYLLVVRNGKEFDSFLTGSDEGLFCAKCPVVLLDEHEFGHMAEHAQKKKRGSVDFAVAGIVNLGAVPKDKENLPFDDDDNPVPLVEFTNAEDEGGGPRTMEAHDHGGHDHDHDHHGHDHDHDHGSHVPHVRAEPKVGRNDPCPCGSGKKFKKCHGQ